MIPPMAQGSTGNPPDVFRVPPKRSGWIPIVAGGIVALYFGVMLLGWATAWNVGYRGIAGMQRVADGTLITDVLPGSPADRAGLRSGDVIVGVNGFAETDRLAVWRVVVSSRPGDQQTLVIRRATPDGTASSDVTTLVVTFRLETITTDPDVIGALTVTTLVGALFLAVALLVGLARPKDPAAMPLLVAAVAFAAMMAMPTIIYLPPEAYLALQELYALPFNLICAALLHLFLLFPAPNPLFERLRRLLPGIWQRAHLATGLLYLIPLSAALLDVLGLARSAGSFTELGYLVATLLALIRSFRHPPTLTARKQVKWIVWALGVAVAGTIFAIAIAGRGFGLSWVITLFPILIWGVVPMALGFSILRHRLFDIDAVVRASITYSVLAITLALGYLAISFGLSRIAAVILTPDENASAGVATIAALVVAAVANPTRLQLQNALDHLVHRDRLARQAFFQEAMAAFGRALPREAVAACLTQQCAKQLDLKGAWLVLADGSTSASDDSSTTPSPNALLTAARGMTGPTLLVADDDVGTTGVPREDVSVSPLRSWYASGARAVVPVRQTNASAELMGVWVLGGRRSEEPFQRDDFIMLQRVGATAALLLDYDHVTAELRGAYAGLEQQVAARTRELAITVQDLQDKSRQLESVSQHKSEFLATMSHELRTPLDVIISLAEVLRERPPLPDDERQDRYLANIVGAGRDLLTLINEILDFAKGEAGRLDLEVRRFAIADVVESSLLWIRERATRRRIAVTMQVDPHLGLIEADERKVKQVLVNLLSNAVKFTGDGGSIHVSAERLPNEVRVSVRDTGIGVAEEDRERIFAPFEQVGSGDQQTEGTGLGLAISRGFVELHGGRLWVESAIGVGSTLIFTLPLSQAPRLPVGPHAPAMTAAFADPWTRPLVSPAAGEHADGAGLTILAIDNHPMAIEVVEAELAPEGYRVLAALDGETGILLARQEQPSLIVLDLLMPGLDGFAVIERLRADPATAAIPVIILTSKTLSAAERTLLSSQVSVIAQKGEFNRAGFVELIRLHARSRTA